MLLSGPQSRLSQRLLFVVSAEGSLLKRETSETGGRSHLERWWGLGPRIWRWASLIPLDGRDPTGSGVQEPEEIIEAEQGA